MCLWTEVYISFITPCTVSFAPLLHILLILPPLHSSTRFSPSLISHSPPRNFGSIPSFSQKQPQDENEVLCCSCSGLGHGGPVCHHHQRLRCFHQCRCQSQVRGLTRGRRPTLDRNISTDLRSINSSSASVSASKASSAAAASSTSKAGAFHTAAPGVGLAAILAAGAYLA